MTTPSPIRMEPGLNGISTKPFAVTPHDETNFTSMARYLYVGTGGDVVVVDQDDDTVTYTNVPDGGYIFCVCKRVNSTNTTATGIVGHE